MEIFELDKNKTTAKTEINAGISTFLTMSYSLILVPLVLSQTGMDFGAALFATAVTSSLACLMMGFFSNYPFAIAPGLGLNAYFTYSIVFSFGYTWQQALGCVFATGCIMLMLNLLGFRRKIIHSIPPSIRLSVASGIGLFLAFIGLKNLELIIPSEHSLVTFGPITLKVLYAGIGIVFVAFLIDKGRMEGIFLSVIGIWLLSLLTGLAEWKGLFGLPPDPSPTFFQLDCTIFYDIQGWSMIASMVFVMLFDSTGSILALAQQGNYFTKENTIPRIRTAFLPDSIGSVIASLLGTSNTTVYLDSVTGIIAGGRTGLTVVTTGVLFLIALFFVPLAQSIPLFAVAPIQIVIGCLMLKQIAGINWTDPTEFIPSSLVMMTIPFTSSIIDGIALGMITYAALKVFTGKWEQVDSVMWILSAIFILRYILL